MRDYSSPGDQVLNGILKAGWIISLPFIWAYQLIQWFVLAVVKETGNKVVKIVGGVIALAIIAYVVQLFTRQ